MISSQPWKQQTVVEISQMILDSYEHWLDS